MKTLSEDSAFPYKYEGGGEWGLTKREYFAALALQGLLSANRTLLSARTMSAGETYAENAVKCADALIDALNGE